VTFELDRNTAIEGKVEQSSQVVVVYASQGPVHLALDVTVLGKRELPQAAAASPP